MRHAPSLIARTAPTLTYGHAARICGTPAQAADLSAHCICQGDSSVTDAHARRIGLIASGHRHRGRRPLEPGDRAARRARDPPRRRPLAKDGPLVVETGKHTGRSRQGQVHRPRRRDRGHDLVGQDQQADDARRISPRSRPISLPRSATRTTLFVAGPLRRLAARASRQRPRDQRACLAQPVHPHAAGPPGSRASWPASSPNITIIDLPSFRADPGASRHAAARR